MQHKLNTLIAPLALIGALPLAHCGSLIDPDQDPSRAQAQALNTGEGEALKFVAGAIPPGSNPYAISGQSFVNYSPVGSSIEQGNGNGALCVSGSVAPVVGDDWQASWGAWVGFNLSPNPTGWPREEVKGFSFRLVGEVPPLMAVSALQSDWDGSQPSYCKRFEGVADASLSVRFDELTEACWAAGGAPLADTPIKAITWTIATDTEHEYPFDFCLTDVIPLVE
jgi:hypothetical protein